MNIEEFARGVYRHMAAGVRGDIEFISSPPPGRKPAPLDVELYNWYSSLTNDSKTMVHALIQRTFEGAIYGLMMVLDHKMFIEEAGDKGELELYYRHPSGERMRLNPVGGEQGQDLEDYFKALRDTDIDS
jgi:hypothetical protein